MISFLKNKKRVFLIAMLLSLGIIVFLVYRQQKQESSAPVSEELADVTPLTFTAEPQSGEHRIGGTKVGISLFFDTTVDPSTVIVESTPPFAFTVTSLADMPDRIILRPITPWQAGTTYTITIKKGIKTEIINRETTEDTILEYRVIETQDIPRNYSPYI